MKKRPKMLESLTKNTKSKWILVTFLEIIQTMDKTKLKINKNVRISMVKPNKKTHTSTKIHFWQNFEFKFIDLKFFFLIELNWI